VQPAHGALELSAQELFIAGAQRGLIAER